MVPLSTLPNSQVAPPTPVSCATTPRNQKGTASHPSKPPNEKAQFLWQPLGRQHTRPLASASVIPSPTRMLEAEEDTFGGDVLHLDYTKRTLVPNQRWILSARQTGRQSKFLDCELGWDEVGRGRDEAEYRKLVKTRIQEV